MPKRIKASSIKEDLLTSIQESWNHSDKEYCFKLVISMPEKERLHTIKARDRLTKYQFNLLSNNSIIFPKYWVIPKYLPIYDSEETLLISTIHSTLKYIS